MIRGTFKKVKFIPLPELTDVIKYIGLSVLAISIGTFIGSITKGCPLNAAAKVDTDIYKKVLGTSLPIIDTVYNSGKASVSLSGEIKKAFGAVFGYELDKPSTVLNSQIPMLKNYYSIYYLPSKLEMKKDEGKTALESKDNVSNENSSSISTSDNEDLVIKEDYSNSGKIAILNETKIKINTDQLLKEPLRKVEKTAGPKVLIFHTHTTEGYVKTPDELGKGKSVIPNWTTDSRYGVVRVGEELANILRKKYGIEVIHNGTIHDYPNYNQSYSNSAVTVEKILKSYPSIKYVIDLHRDGLGTDEKLRAVTKINSRNAAQVMFVIGTNNSGLFHPNWKENLKLALRLQDRLNVIAPGITKPIDISRNRYNQHLSQGAIIVEIGGDGNLLDECIVSTGYIAKALNDVINTK